jgi:4-alpha-glucanotransferase
MADVRALARAAGIDPEYVSWTGAPTSSSEASLLSALKALAPDLGIQVSSDDDVRGALADVERNRWNELVPPVVVGWDGSIVVPFAVPASADHDWEIEVTTESGRTHRANGRLFALPADSHAWPGGQVHCLRRASVWLDGELGYHQIAWRCGVERGRALGIAAPSKAFGGPGGPRRWGVFAPVYGLASPASGGAGDLANLRVLFDAVAKRGGRYVATMPILAAFLDEPYHFSPYSPASRHYWNELYLDLGKLADDTGLSAPTAPPVAPGLIDYRAQYQWRREALIPFTKALLAKHGPEIDRWTRETTTYDYAAFRAISETTRTSWREWPAMWRDELPLITTREAAVSNGIDGERLDVHVVAQWAMQRQLESLTDEYTRRHVTLYLDLPVGVSCDAYEVWRDRHLFLTSLAAGAPPDPLFLGGQNWGLPPLSPIAARRDHYRYVIRCIRHHMKVAGMLRIDHVMGLFRLYVVPDGRPATDGVYLRYHAEDLLAILALESVRHQCALVGEDLGTVPDHVRPAMARHGMFRLHVGQWFLPGKPGQRPAPSPPESIASLNTHDTATFAGWWRGADIDDRHDLKLIDDAHDAKERRERADARAAMLAFANPSPDDHLTEVERAMVAATADLAAGPAEVVLVALDDLALDPVPHNVPGTTSERPNWQRRVEGWATALTEQAAPAAAEAITAVANARRS